MAGNPTKSGLTFKGWVVYAAAGSTISGWPTGLISPSLETLPLNQASGNVVLKACWSDECVVTYDANGHGTPPCSVIVKSGEKTTNPGIIEGVEGYTHDGNWYKETGCTTQFDFDNTAITTDITLYAKWDANVYSITYLDQGSDTA